MNDRFLTVKIYKVSNVDPSLRKLATAIEVSNYNEAIKVVGQELRKRKDKRYEAFLEEDILRKDLTIGETNTYKLSGLCWREMERV